MPEKMRGFAPVFAGVAGAVMVAVVIVVVLLSESVVSRES